MSQGFRSGSHCERHGCSFCINPKERSLQRPKVIGAQLSRWFLFRGLTAFANCRRRKCAFLSQRGLAGAPGFEPGITGPKPVALPLGHAPEQGTGSLPPARSRQPTRGQRRSSRSATSASTASSTTTTAASTTSAPARTGTSTTRSCETAAVQVTTRTSALSCSRPQVT